MRCAYGVSVTLTCVQTPRDDDDVFEVIIPDIAASKDDPTVTFSKSWPVAELAASLGPLFPGTGASVCMYVCVCVCMCVHSVHRV